MNANYASLICGFAIATAVATPASAGQGPGRPPARVAPSLDAVLPLLDKAVVRVRTPSEAQLASSDATLEAARDGVATTDLTGLRLRDDLVLVAVPGTGALPTSFDVGVFGAWAPAPVIGTDTARRLVLVRAGQRPGSAPAPAVTAGTPKVPGFLVSAASIGSKLDVRTAWIERTEGVDLPDGAYVFGVDGSLAGLAAGPEGRRAILPAAAVLEAGAVLAGKAR